MASEGDETGSKQVEPLQLRHMLGDVYVTIQHKKEYIEAKWSGHITADDVVQAAQAFVYILDNSHCTKLLNDKSDIIGDWQEANDWLEFEWLPKVVSGGLRCIAHVYSHNMFSLLSALDFQERIMPQIQIRNFYEREAAETWLASCGNPE